MDRGRTERGSSLSASDVGGGRVGWRDSQLPHECGGRGVALVHEGPGLGAGGGGWAPLVAVVIGLERASLGETHVLGLVLTQLRQVGVKG